MSFKKNLLAKIRIEELARRVNASLKPAEGLARVDREALKRLLALSPYRHRHERDLDLYVDASDPGTPNVLVLDNDLPLYRTTVADVLLRKSPTIKEMVSIRNAIKILNDRDVLLSKKETTVARLRKTCLAGLDLRFQRADIEAIAHDGVVALAIEDADGVVESLSLFAELLGYGPPPASFETGADLVIGRPDPPPGEGRSFGPLIVYRKSDNTLKYIEKKISLSRRELFLQALRENEKIALNGETVFQCLQDAVYNSLSSFQVHPD